MAVARQVQVAAGEDGLVAVQRDIIVDPERGIAAEVEKVVVAVDVGDGKIAVMEQSRVKSVTDLPSSGSQRAIAAPRRDPSPPRYTRQQDSDCCVLL